MNSTRDDRAIARQGQLPNEGSAKIVVRERLPWLLWLLLHQHIPIVLAVEELICHHIAIAFAKNSDVDTGAMRYLFRNLIQYGYIRVTLAGLTITFPIGGYPLRQQGGKIFAFHIDSRIFDRIVQIEVP